MGRNSKFEFNKYKKYDASLFITWGEAKEYYYSARYHGRKPRFKQIDGIGYLVALDLPKSPENNFKFSKLCLKYSV